MTTSVQYGHGLPRSSSVNGDNLVNISASSFICKQLHPVDGIVWFFPVVRCHRQGQGVEISSENLPFESYGSKKARDLLRLMTSQLISLH